MPYQHFTSDERDMLQVMTDRGVGIMEITRGLGKHISFIYRELSRNTSSGFYLSIGQIRQPAYFEETPVHGLVASACSHRRHRAAVVPSWATAPQERLTIRRSLHPCRDSLDDCRIRTLDLHAPSIGAYLLHAEGNSPRMASALNVAEGLR